MPRARAWRERIESFMVAVGWYVLYLVGRGLDLILASMMRLELS